MQGTQSQHTKANLAKEPTLFLRFQGHTLINRTQYVGEHILTKGERRGGLPKYGLTLVNFGICNSTVLHIHLDIIYLAFCCYVQLQVFNHHRYGADGIVPVLRKARPWQFWRGCALIILHQNLSAVFKTKGHCFFIFACSIYTTRPLTNTAKKLTIMVSPVA